MVERRDIERDSRREVYIVCYKESRSNGGYEVERGKYKDNIRSMDDVG